MNLIRFCNKFLIDFQNKYLKNSFVLGYPYQIYLDPCNKCSVGCVLCPTGQNDEGRKIGEMALADFKKIIDEIGIFIYGIDFTNWGDAFLNYDFLAMVRLAKTKRITCYVSSTLSTIDITDERAIKTIESELDFIQVFISGITQETARVYQRDINLDRVFNNIRKIAETKARLHKVKPYIQIKFVVSRYSENELNAAKKLPQELGADKIIFAPIGPMKNDVLTKDTKLQCEQIKEWVPRNEKYNIIDADRGIIKKGRIEDCDFLWRTATINWDGSVSPCCVYYSQKYDFGNCLKRSFKDVWNNRNYRLARKIVGKNLFVNDDIICQRCHHKNK